jgi:hypothetical protein
MVGASSGTEMSIGEAESVGLKCARNTQSDLDGKSWKRCPQRSVKDAKQDFNASEYQKEQSRSTNSAKSADERGS